MIGFDALAAAVLLGVAFAIGVCLVLSVAPRWGAPSLARRIAPYVRDVTDPRGVSFAPSRASLDVASLWSTVASRLGRVIGGDAVLERRLRQAGWSIEPEAFRGRQLAAALGGLGIGGAIGVALVLAGRGGIVLPVVAVVLALAGIVACDLVLSRAVRARTARIEEELPVVLEFLALCLSAGEGILDSLRRVGAVGSGELTAEVRAAVIAVGTGSSLSDALGALSARLDVPALSRALDQLVAAIDRGAPLAQVLHAQAADAREDSKRSLIERAGRKEILMLIPLVFLVLPLSVLFAVFPGVFMLRLGIG